MYVICVLGGIYRSEAKIRWGKLCKIKERGIQSKFNAYDFCTNSHLDVNRIVDGLRQDSANIVYVGQVLSLRPLCFLIRAISANPVCSDRNVPPHLDASGNCCDRLSATIQRSHLEGLPLPGSHFRWFGKTSPQTRPEKCFKSLDRQPQMES